MQTRLYSSRWSRKGSFGGPSSLNPVPQRHRMNACFSAPCGHRFGLASERQHAVVGSVYPLRNARRPSTVARFVVPVVVDTVEGQPCRTLSHIGKKVLEPQPTRTNCDPATTISGVRLAAFVETPLAHSAPNAKFLGFAHPVSRVSLGGQFGMETPTTMSLPGDQCSGRDVPLVSAVADAEPFDYSPNSRRSYWSPPSESFPGDIYSSCHGVFILPEWRMN